MATAEGTKGQGRVTVFSMFGPVFGYATTLVDDRQVAYVGPLTPGVEWRLLWRMADKCMRPRDRSESEHAKWIITQANRSFITGSDVVVKLSEADWVMEPNGRRVELDGSWSNQDVLVTGNLTVPALAAEQTARKFTYWPHYAA
ncbi:hypothetical protein ACIQPR_43470 [Streptomyces sp. NPDC091280]|uniref:hypothetical protein n=1 Tax=Streptomyces sp. NPDC091280 TaxID=3365984 RepID=UPI00381C543C